MSQAHPDKTLARQLHASQPQHYRDPNHKPEMAVALTAFEAMCGFRPLKEILGHLASYPELADIVGAVAPQEESAEHLKSIFSNFMQAPEELVRAKLQELVRRLEESAPPAGGLDALILRLHKDFPNDRGALCPLILNYINLSPGQFQMHRINHFYHSFTIIRPLIVYVSIMAKRAST